MAVCGEFISKLLAEISRLRWPRGT